MLPLVLKYNNTQSGTLKLATYFEYVSSPTKSSTALLTLFLTETCSTTSFNTALASSSPNVHKNESTVDSDSLCLLHTSLISPMKTFPHFSTIMTFSGVLMSVFSQISFRFGELLTGFAKVISLLASCTGVEGIAKLLPERIRSK